MIKLLELLALLFVASVIVFQDQRRSFWKERYEHTSAWADTLYEENLRLCDTITYLKRYNVKNSSDSFEPEVAR